MNNKFIISPEIFEINFKHIFILLWLMLMPLSLHAEDLSATITVDVSRERPVNQLLFGQNTLAYDLCAEQPIEMQTSICRNNGSYSNMGAGQWNPILHSPTADLLIMGRKIGISLLRYPGGVPANYYDWKQTIGPLENRPMYQFGLDEFMRLCEDLGAQAMITLNYYTGTDQDFADLVEYLNAPANADKPWAQRRAANGYPQPYNVKNFELGCEVQIDPNAYARRYQNVQNKLKKIDANVKLGAVFDTAAANMILAEYLGDTIDFGIVHLYPPWYTRNDSSLSTDELFLIALAGPEQIRLQLERMQSDLRLFTGKSIPIAITEYNGGFVQERPVPYRHSLGNALVNADLLQVFMTVEAPVLCANYWQFSNSYWGMVYNNLFMYKPETAYQQRPNYLMFLMYKEHFGTRLVDVKIDCPAYVSKAYGRVFATVNKPNPRDASTQIIRKSSLVLKPDSFSETPAAGVKVNRNTKEIYINFSGCGDINYFHTRTICPVNPGHRYLIRAKIKTAALTSNHGICLEVQDKRGYDKTHWAIATNAVSGTSEWKTVTAVFEPMDKNADQVCVIIRRFSGDRPISGSVWVKDIKLTDLGPKLEYTATPYLSAVASLSDDGRKMYLMVINKHPYSNITGNLAFRKFNAADRIETWTLNGPALDSTNESLKPGGTIKTEQRSLKTGANTLRFPPHSLTAIELYRMN